MSTLAKLDQAQVIRAVFDQDTQSLRVTIGAADIELENDQYLKSRNATDDGDVNLIKADEFSRIHIGDNADLANNGGIYINSNAGVVLGNDFLNAGTATVEIIPNDGSPDNARATFEIGGNDYEGYIDLSASRIYHIGSFGMTGQTQQWIIFDLDNDHNLTVQAPDVITADYTLKWPATGPAADGVVGVSAAGQLSCVAGASGTFTSADAKTVTVVNGVITSIV